MFFFFTMLYLIFTIFLFQNCRKKNLSYPFFFFFLMILITTIFFLFHHQISFLFSFLIFFSIVPFFFFILFHFLFHKRPLLHKIHHRYFYIFSIILYFFLLVLLSCRVDQKLYQTGISTTSILILSFSFLALIVKSTIKKERKPKKRWSISNLPFYPVLVILSILIHQSFLSHIHQVFYQGVYYLTMIIPMFLCFYYRLKEKEEQVVIDYLTQMLLLPFFLISFLDLTLMRHSIYFYVTDFSVILLKIGLYSITILLLPTMKRFSNLFYYDLCIFFLILIFAILLLV